MIRAALPLLLLLLAMGSAARAAAILPSPDWLAAQSNLCTQAIAAAETRYHLPHGLLGTMSRVESGRPITGMGDIRAWPWAIDADGTALFLDSKQAAMVWVAQALARKRAKYIDVGCLQVDLQMHPDAFPSLATAFDPGANADYAARYLLALHAEAHGDWNLAVGLYHSHTPELAAEYRDRVAAMGRGIVSGVGGPEPLYQRAIRQGTLRLALAGGGQLVLHVREPLEHRRPMTACAVQAMLGDYLSRKLRAHCAPAVH